MGIPEWRADITAHLADAGFGKRKPVYTIDMGDDDVLGWLGLNQASKGLPAGVREINPVIGVHHQEIERLVAEFCGYKPQVVATICSPLGYLEPEHRFHTWRFGPGVDVNTTREMVGRILAYGLPYMRRHVPIRELCRALDEAHGDYMSVYRRPVAWMLAGETARSEQLLQEALTKMEGRTDPAAEMYRRFVPAFQQYASVRA